MIAVQVLNGLMEGMMLFLIASGLTLIFGITRIVNFAHGSFYMLGAFLTYQTMPYLAPDTAGGFALAVLVAAVTVAVLGMAFEVLVLRRIYGADDSLQLIITLALVLVIRDVVRAIWGPSNVTVPMPADLSGALQVGGSYFPVFQLVVFGMGLVVVLLMIAAIRYTRAGILLRAAADDRGMVALLGINQARIFTGVFTAGCFLAGLAGGLAAPFGNVNYLLDTTVIVMAFIVVVIGGLGNIRGAIVGALLIGMTRALAQQFAPDWTNLLTYALLILTLIVRPEGLFNRRGRQA